MLKVKGPFVSVVIPAYNEAGRLPLTLIDVDRHLKEQNYSYEIIVVNDGSVDETAEIIKRFKPLISRFKFIDNPKNMGWGSAVRIGMLSAKGQWRIAMDASNCTTIVEFTKMLPYLKKDEYDIVVGSKFVRGASIRPPLPFITLLLEKKINWFAKILLGIPVGNGLSRFVCYKGMIADSVFEKIKSERWAVSPEALMLAQKMRYRIKEIPIFVARSKKSNLHFSRYLQIAGELIKMRWWLRRGQYSLKK